MLYPLWFRFMFSLPASVNLRCRVVVLCRKVAVISFLETDVGDPLKIQSKRIKFAARLDVWLTSTHHAAHVCASFVSLDLSRDICCKLTAVTSRSCISGIWHTTSGLCFYWWYCVYPTVDGTTSCVVNWCRWAFIRPTSTNRSLYVRFLGTKNPAFTQAGGAVLNIRNRNARQLEYVHGWDDDATHAV